ncbi:MAG: hypothetical protein OQK82_07110 [Candidatus Pacearchaeota archaeon]|nr:hypothetical protein [Candidatus Pacearchaeota archaeon]
MKTIVRDYNVNMENGGLRLHKVKETAEHTEQEGTWISGYGCVFIRISSFHDRDYIEMEYGLNKTIYRRRISRFDRHFRIKEIAIKRLANRFIRDYNDQAFVKQNKKSIDNSLGFLLFKKRFWSVSKLRNLIYKNHSK